MKNKKAVSEMVVYPLLMVITTAITILVYRYLVITFPYSYALTALIIGGVVLINLVFLFILKIRQTTY
jgi:hypothetical protein